MSVTLTNNLKIKQVNSFEISANKLTLLSEDPERDSNSHIHPTCEIYLNVSGNVSFMVEKNIYPIRSGDIIITRPYEYHHCIYHDDSPHEHYCIFFSAEQNPELFGAFFNRSRGSDNLIRFSESESKRFISLCDKISTADEGQALQVMTAFFDILSSIEGGAKESHIQNINSSLPENINNILGYINKNYASIKNVNELSEYFHISISTLERQFNAYLSTSPKKYLTDKKLSGACRMLRQNKSVTEACFENGFNDLSHFIDNFKKKFGTTPLKYKKDMPNYKQ